jgi:hypothetical protein
MMEQSLYTILGVVIGAGISTTIWFLMLKNRSVAQDKIKEEQERLMYSIGENIAAIESLIISLNAGDIKERAFHDTLKISLDAVIKNYKPNFHLLDVYFVKYADLLLAGYNDLLLRTKGDESVVMDSDTVPLVGIEVEKTSSTETVKEVSTTSEIADFAEKKSVDASEISIVSTDSLIGQDTASLNEKNASEFEEEFFKISNEASAPEIKESITLDDTHDSDVIFASSDELKKAPLTLEESIVKNETNQKLPPFPKDTDDDDLSDEEDFTMETIMDLDISKLSRLTSSDVTKKGHSGAIPRELVKNKSSELRNIDTDKTDKVQSSEIHTTNTLDTPAAIKTDGELDIAFEEKKSDAPVAPKISSNGTSKSSVDKRDIVRFSNDTKNEGITGDDVAHQIDSLFGFDK